MTLFKDSHHVSRTSAVFDDTLSRQPSLQQNFSSLWWQPSLQQNFSSLWWHSLKTAITSAIFDDSAFLKRTLRGRFRGKKQKQLPASCGSLFRLRHYWTIQSHDLRTMDHWCFYQMSNGKFVLHPYIQLQRLFSPWSHPIHPWREAHQNQERKLMEEEEEDEDDDDDDDDDDDGDNGCLALQATPSWSPNSCAAASFYRLGRPPKPICRFGNQFSNKACPAQLFTLAVVWLSPNGHLSCPPQIPSSLMHNRFRFCVCFKWIWS